MFNAIKKLLRKDSPPFRTEPAEEGIRNLLIHAHGELADGQFSAAASSYTKYLRQKPEEYSAHIGLGCALLNLGDAKGAESALRQARSIQALSPDGHFLLGQSLLAGGKTDEAIAEFEAAHRLSPEFEPVYLELCFLFFRTGKLDRAEALMHTATRYFPNNGNIWFYLGNVQAEQGRFHSANSSYERAVALEPDSAGLLASYGNSLMQTGETKSALGVLRQALTLDASAAATFSNYLLCLQYLQDATPAERFEAAREFSQRFEEPLSTGIDLHASLSKSTGKIRIGYVSGDFRNHSLAFFIAPVLIAHDRSRFELFGYYAHPAVDAQTEVIRAQFDTWLPCHDLSDDELAARIRADEIDVLIDLSGHTGNNRLLAFARRPAPIQMTWLGYLATTGLKAMDYRITDASLDPPGTTERFHTEKLLRLSSSGVFSPHPSSPPVNPLPVLQGQTFTFACLNNPSKITDEALDLWARILLRCPGSRLSIGNATPGLTERLTTHFALQGVSAERLLFHPKVGLDDYLALHHGIDLALDTFPYNGGTTTFHSLWMGVPVVALEGDTPLSRAGTSILKGMGLDGFCADTPEAYVDLAVHHFQHPQMLASVRQSLRATIDQVSEQQTKRMTAELEEKIQQLVRGSGPDQPLH